MLPEQYTRDLTIEQNFYGDGFDRNTFLDTIADQYEERRDRIYARDAAHRAVAEIEYELRDKAGLDLSQVDGAFDEIYTETQDALRPEAVATVVRRWSTLSESVVDDWGAEAKEQAADMRRAGLHIKLFVLDQLRHRRQFEQMPPEKLRELVPAEVQRRPGVNLVDEALRLSSRTAPPDIAKATIPAFGPLDTSGHSSPEASGSLPAAHTDSVVEAIEEVIRTMGGKESD